MGSDGPGKQIREPGGERLQMGHSAVRLSDFMDPVKNGENPISVTRTEDRIAGGWPCTLLADLDTMNPSCHNVASKCLNSIPRTRELQASVEVSRDVVEFCSDGSATGAIR